MYTGLKLLLDARILCEIESNLSTADESKFKRKNRHFWNTGKPYLRVEFQVKVLIGPADLRFELCSSTRYPIIYPELMSVLRV